MRENKRQNAVKDRHTNEENSQFNSDNKGQKRKILKQNHSHQNKTQWETFKAI